MNQSHPADHTLIQRAYCPDRKPDRAWRQTYRVWPSKLTWSKGLLHWRRCSRWHVPLAYNPGLSPFLQSQWGYSDILPYTAMHFQVLHAREPATIQCPVSCQYTKSCSPKSLAFFFPLHLLRFIPILLWILLCNWCTVIVETSSVCKFLLLGHYPAGQSHTVTDEYSGKAKEWAGWTRAE